MLLLGLVLGALLGAAVTFLLLRERMRAALTQNRAGEEIGRASCRERV